MKSPRIKHLNKDDFDRFTDSMLQLLHLIKTESPVSVEALAKIAGKDLESVNTDLKILKELGLVSLEKSEAGRAKVRPEVEFDKLNIEIALT